MSALQKRGKGFLVATDLAVTAPELKTNKLVFLHTDLGHNDVLAKRNTYCQFLRTSFLAAIAKD